LEIVKIPPENSLAALEESGNAVRSCVEVWRRERGKFWVVGAEKGGMQGVEGFQHVDEFLERFGKVKE
jgi:hypothetical protein